MLLFMACILSLALKSAGLPCSADFSNITFQAKGFHPRKAIGQLQVHFSSHKNPLSSIFLGFQRDSLALLKGN